VLLLLLLLRSLGLEAFVPLALGACSLWYAVRHPARCSRAVIPPARLQHPAQAAPHYAQGSRGTPAHLQTHTQACPCPAISQGNTLRELLHNAANAAKVRAARPAVMQPESVELDGVPAVKVHLFKQDAITGGLGGVRGVRTHVHNMLEGSRAGRAAGRPA